MRKPMTLLIAATFVFAIACSQKVPDGFVLVKGGTFVNTKSNLHGKNVAINDFYMGRYEVTQSEWVEVMGYNPSRFNIDNLPVEMVSWYDCVEYCNLRSIKEGLEPYYMIYKNLTDPTNQNEIDSVKWTVTINPGANGYRLPTEVEWEYAASGGQKSKGYTYSGGNDLDQVAWYWKNSGDLVLAGHWHWSSIENNNCKTKPVGSKKSNELGLYDMSGNVREWCSNWYLDSDIDYGFVRVQRGGGWMGGEHACVLSFRGNFNANGKGPDQGFRLARNK